MGDRNNVCIVLEIVFTTTFIMIQQPGMLKTPVKSDRICLFNLLT